MTLKPIFSALLLLHCSFCTTQDYYWKDYFGEIPQDAFLAGKTYYGKVYVGQAYLRNIGLIPTKIRPGVKEVEVPHGGSKVVNEHIKILCGSQGSFYWMITNSTSFHSQVVDKHVVLGGHQDQDPHGSLNIGRVHRSGDVKIGKIGSFWPEPALYFSESGSEHKELLYEVLMYQNSSIKLDVE